MTIDELLAAELAKKPWNRRVFAITADGRGDNRGKLFRCRTCKKLVQAGDATVIEKFEKVTYGWHRECLAKSTLDLPAVAGRCGY